MNEQSRFPDQDPQETREWLDSMESVIDVQGRRRSHYLIDQLLDLAASRHGDSPRRVSTPYAYTITPDPPNPSPYADSPLHIPLQRMSTVSLPPSSGYPTSDAPAEHFHPRPYTPGDRSCSTHQPRYTFPFTLLRSYRILG